MTSAAAGAIPSQDEDQLHAARNLTRSVRRLSDAVMRMPAGPATAQLVSDIEALIERIRPHQRASSVPWYYDDLRTTRNPAERLRRLAEDHDELSDFNPMMPPLQVTMHEGALSGRVVVGPSFTGPPGLVHGGTQSAMLDHIMGLLVTSTGRAAVTARLEVDFRQGAPIESELELAAHIESIEDRKVRVRGEIRFGGAVCTAGSALFVVIRPRQRH